MKITYLLCVTENFSYVKKSCDDEDCSRGKTVNEVVDDGRIPGDGRGACGFDSSLYMYASFLKSCYS